ncbi:uncharacterized protein [Typha latifolia]|uniref:uncharacterized protein n=1 Tax=Typha latifolia TaxID=4733 RepID=UPI003C2E5144
MAMATKIVRSSINAFFKNYHSFTSIAGFLIFPSSAMVLLSEALIPSSPSFFRIISARLRLMFEAAGFPEYSNFFAFLNLKLSQTIFSFIFTLPSTLTFLLLAKASIITIFRRSQRSQQVVPPSSKFLPLYFSLLMTHLFNSFVILSSNAAVFTLLFLLFNAVDVLGISSSTVVLFLSVAGVVLYSVVLAVTMVICNLAIIVSAMEDCIGYVAVLKACVLINGRLATALTVALPTNFMMAAAEALFQFRVMNQYKFSNKFNPLVIWEAFSITYTHSLFVVLEIIVSYMFLKSCKSGQCSTRDCGFHDRRELEPEEKSAAQV